MESWKRKLRMGMVGGGPGAFIGAVHRTVATMDGQAELVAGCFSQDPQKSRQTGKELYLDPARCYDSYEQMAEAEAKLPADRRIDFVTIVTPNVSHFPIAKTFLEAGFHVVCDKPMTYSLEQAEELVKLVDKTGLVFAVTYNYSGYPLVRHARELCRSGELGRVQKVIVEYLQEFLAVPQEKLGSKQAAWRTDPAQAGIAGTMGDVGTHCYHLLEYITGDPVVELCADKCVFMPERRLDEDSNVLLRLKGGGKGVLTISQVAAGEDNGLKIRIYGTKGAVLWAQEYPNDLYVYRVGQPRQILTRGHADYLSPAATAINRLPAGHTEGYLEAFANIYVGAIEAIRRHIDGKPMKRAEYAFPSVEDGRRGMELITKSVQSWEKGSVWVST
jgi:predicted dehydrogenase